MIDIHTHNEFSVEGVLCVRNLFPSQVNEYSPEGFYSLGIHPWYINEGSIEDETKILKTFASCSNLLAVGEAGLDKVRGADFALQVRVFRLQCMIAEEYCKPMIIHCVRAFNEVIAIWKELKPQFPRILHGFNARYEVAESLLRNGMYLSFGENILQEGSNAAFVLKEVPDNSFFLETDDSGVGIAEIYDKAAQIRSCSVWQLDSVVRNNFRNTFGTEWKK